MEQKGFKHHSKNKSLNQSLLGGLAKQKASNTRNTFNKTTAENMAESQAFTKTTAHTKAKDSIGLSSVTPGTFDKDRPSMKPSEPISQSLKRLHRSNSKTKAAQSNVRPKKEHH